MFLNIPRRKTNNSFLKITFSSVHQARFQVSKPEYIWLCKEDSDKMGIIPYVTSQKAQTGGGFPLLLLIHLGTWKILPFQEVEK